VKISPCPTPHSTNVHRTWLSYHGCVWFVSFSRTAQVYHKPWPEVLMRFSISQHLKLEGTPFVVTPSAYGATSCVGRPMLSALTWCLLQVRPKLAFYILPLLLAFLGSALGWPGSQSCSVQEVLRHYQAVIFQDLQTAMQWAGLGVQHTQPGSRHHRFIQKNLTGAGGGQGQPGTSCDAQKVWGRFPQTTICLLLRPHPHVPPLLWLSFLSNLGE
jgi:hypothetical protein